MTLKLADTALPTNLVTSPMCGITNRPFRKLCRKFGSSLTYVEMLQTRGVVDRRPRTMEILTYFPDEKPLGAQFAGSDPEELAQACRIAEDLGFDTIDLNSGCPSGRVGKGLLGARLMSRPDLAAACMRAMREAVEVPVTVKIRAGMDGENLNYLELGRIAQEEGMNWITIHPRTRAQGYKGTADHRISAELKANLSIPVIGSGDVTEPEHALRLTREFGLDGVMIGRGLFGKPWLYRRILAAQRGEDAPELPPPREVLGVMRSHFEGLMEIVEPRRACILQRRYSGWYIKGIPGAARLRARFVQIETPEEFQRTWAEVDQRFAELEASGAIKAAPPESGV